MRPRVVAPPRTLPNQGGSEARRMTSPSSDAPTADEAPAENALTDYDRRHLTTYVWLLDAVATGADWRAVSRDVLGIDPDHAAARARRAYDSHLARARWMTE